MSIFAGQKSTPSPHSYSPESILNALLHISTGKSVSHFNPNISTAK